ncbi:MAG: GH32 C-terminal domain-containing protein [Phycisphaerae bacterium]|nr:GH32 C-terminal domain-containing protein [Phycisphaerae bacterium]
MCLLWFAGCAAPTRGAGDIVIADFEGKDYGDWKATGEAFGPGPARGTLPHQMEVSGFEGSALVNTFYKGDGTTGTLTSPLFTIQRKYLNFLIGGGMHPGKACINLLVDGKAVRTATGPNDRPGGTEALDWHSWDVADLVGKTAHIEIVDQATGGWGHINVDQIVQSDTKAAAATEKTMELVCNKRYLNLPVKNGARKRWVSLAIDGKTVREFDIELADADPSFWVVLDLTPFKGKPATLKISALRDGAKALDLIHQADAIKDSQNLYKEKYRPQFHFSSRRGWNNDSNGMVYYKGEYHLFYQHNPFGWKWGNMTWGHAVSKDLVHWTELEDAIHPDKLGTIFSGSAVVDENNTAGFQTGKEKVIVCIYTSAGGTNRWSKGQPFTQSIAYSNDRGRTWTAYDGNPVLGHINKSNRDPKVIWHEPTKRWVMVLYLDDKRMSFLTSKDLKSWHAQSELTCFHECPELFELPVDGDDKNKKWVLYGAAGDYLLGRFDGKTFKPDGQAIKFNHGNCFYASQTFNNVPPSDGRRIQIAWGRIGHKDMPFNQMMDFPVELTLRATDEGVRMFAVPVREIAKLHGKKHAWKSQTVKEDANLLKDIKGDLFHIRAELDPGQAKELGFVIRGTPVTYNAKRGQLACNKCKAPVKPTGGKVRLEILVDRMSIEIFAGDGRVYMPIGVIPPDDNKTLEIFAKGGPAKATVLDVRELKSAWK